MRDSVRSFAKIAMQSLIVRCSYPIIDPHDIAKLSFDIAYAMEEEYRRREQIDNKLDKV